MPPTPDTPESRARMVKLWSTGLALVVLLGLTVAAGMARYPFFAVAAGVLAVFAAVELTWLLRRSPGRDSPTGDADRGAEGSR